MPGVVGGKTLRAALPLIVAAGLLFGFYLWTASAGLPLGFGEAQDRHYNLLTRALLQGHLHIDVEPRPELFELTEPYRPGRNAPFRYHDASLYRGRYYLYFGVVPVLVAFGPWRLVGLGRPARAGRGSGLRAHRLRFQRAASAPPAARALARGPRKALLLDLWRS